MDLDPATVILIVMLYLFIIFLPFWLLWMLYKFIVRRTARIWRKGLED
jgi:hypothetical protein